MLAEAALSATDMCQAAQHAAFRAGSAGDGDTAPDPPSDSARYEPEQDEVQGRHPQSETVEEFVTEAEWIALLGSDNVPSPWNWPAPRHVRWPS